MNTNTYIVLRGDYRAKKAALATKSREWLEGAVLDERYNYFMSENSDFREDDDDPWGHGKKIPYIGWYWRHVEFSEPDLICVGDCGSFIGFMVNNKWDYPERYLTEDEAMKVISIIDLAMDANESGGLVSDIHRNRDGHLLELWEYMQTLNI